MAYNAILNFEENEFDVVKCECSIGRELDSKGRPSSNLYGGTVTIQIESTADNTIFISMASQFKSNSGTITFKKDEADMMKKIAWENGYIIHFEERMNNNNGVPMLLCFTVSAQTIIAGGEKLKQNWPEISS